MRILFALYAFCCFFFSSSLKANVPKNIQLSFRIDTIIIPDTLSETNSPVSDTEVRIIFQADSLADTTKNNKVVAAILAFPFPFGMLGLHRVYLGTKPYIPFVYIGTIGGCFLILPFIDFCTIIFSDDEMFRSFENNRKVFMWTH